MKNISPVVKRRPTQYIVLNGDLKNQENTCSGVWPDISFNYYMKC